MKKKLLLLLAFLSLSCYAQFSKTHYIPPLSSSANVIPEDQYLYISTPNLNPVNFRIINIGGSVINGTVSRTAPYVHNVGTGDNTQLNVRRNSAGNVFNNKGYIVEAEDLIYVSARVVAGSSNQAGEIVSKGLAALGTEFRIGAFENTAVSSYYDIHYTFVSILATENNTTVSFSDINEGVQLVNDTGIGNALPPIVLNSGQSYVFAVEGPEPNNRDGLIGALISSDKPIAVNCGSYGGSNGNMNNLDLGFDQIVSAERTGTDYIFIRSTGMDEVEHVLLIAHEDNTDIFLSGNTTPAATLNAGEYISFGGNSYTAAGNLYVHTSKNVFAYQSIGDNSRPDQANQELFFVPPLSCETPRIIDNIPFLDQIGIRVFTGRVTLVTLAGATLTFTINGDNYTLNSLPPEATVQGPIAVEGNNEYETYTITGLSGHVSVFSTGQLYLASYGSSDAATFGGFYSGFTFKPEIAFDRLDVSQPNCLPNVMLSVSPLTAFDIFQWYFNDAPIAGAVTNSFSPTTPGYYHVAATIGACGTTLISDKIPVSSCASDIDNDLTNDNIDIDMDNDGIVNCVESYGNLALNLSNPFAGPIAMGNYSNSFTGNLPVGVGAPAAVPFSGTSAGSFTIETSAGKGNTTIYRAAFAQPLSIEMQYIATAAPEDLLRDDSEIVLSVPVDRTITIQNPNNQLLIDTNYDGIFESGVTEYSSFEIRFRLNSSNPLPAGTGTFRLRSYLIESVQVLQRNLRADRPVRSSFRLTATCLPKDSDNDQVPDQTDFDSDNDGIPDLNEVMGSEVIALSGVDANHDGLDDAFGSGLTPADSDGDLVPDYLDLDSDNNGIYDLYESGHSAPDTNSNGIIDGSPTIFGTNGLANLLETVPDSNVINYTVSDSDADGNPDFSDPDNDGDLCNDVLEAGFQDQNNDGFLGALSPPPVNASGVVTGAGGYSLPNPEVGNPAPIIVNLQPQNVLACENQNAVFTIDAIAGVTFKWQISTNGVNFSNLTDNATYSGTQTATLTVSSVTPAMDGNVYRVQLSRAGNVCGLTSSQAVLSINALPDVVSATLTQCDTGDSPDGIALFNLTEATASLTSGNTNLQIAFFENPADAAANANELPVEYTNTANPQTLVVKITDLTSGCFSFSSLNLNVNVVANQELSLPALCDYDGIEDGFHSFDLTSAGISLGVGQTIAYYETETDALLEQDAISNPATYVNLVPYELQQVYARVDNALGCSAIKLINIKVNRLPDIDANLDLENHVVCVNSTTFTTTIDAAILDGSSPSDYDYQWSFEGTLIPGATSPTLTVSQEGTYTVEVTNAVGCSKIRTIPVISSSVAIVESIDIVDLSENNTITVTLTSNSYGDYVYSLDFPNAFQPSNVFYDVAPGIHTVYIKDLNGCPNASEEISVLGIPNYFTPNADGFHDTWNIKGTSSRYYPETTVKIFDRYGKLLKVIGGAGEGWDGTYNGTPMPSTDYWYVVEFADGRTMKGHFSLKR